MRFIHTADWQLGKPYASVEDSHKRTLLQEERIAAIQRIAKVADDERAEFALVAGDLFDTPSVTKSVVSRACSAIGSLEIPVFAIPGNHDHGGPGSIWAQPFFKRERDELAPNLRVLLSPEPLETESAVIFPCPLLRRHESSDPTAWLRDIEISNRFGGKPRIVLAHGSVHGFSADPDEDEPAGGTPNLISLGRLPDGAFDYIALGDWHGAKRVGTKAWYSGTPELDRFPRGETSDPGQVLSVSVERGGEPEVRRIRTARFGWHRLAADFTDDSSIEALERMIDGLIGSRAGEDLLRLELSGSLGLAASARLEERLDAWTARFLRLKLFNGSIVAPSGEEIESLTRRAGDPLIARVAAKLLERASGAGEDAAIARVALRELHASCLQG